MLRLIARSLGLFLWFAAPGVAETSVVTSFHQASGEDRFVLDIAAVGQPETRLMVLQNPERVVLDLFDTVAADSPGAVEGSQIVASVRDGLAASNRYRLVFDLASPAVPHLTRNEAGGSTALTLELRKASSAEFAAALERRPQTDTGSDAQATPGRARDIVIMLDPGHGGIDNGAVGKGGTFEKDLNLAFAKVLAARLSQNPSYDVMLTRTDDVLLPLAERSAGARRAGADLFVSLHADSIRFDELRGATVYTLTEEASDPLAQEIADSENAADRFVGPGWEADTPEIHAILVDLVRRETEVLSERLADNLVLNLKRNEIRLINNPKRSAGFRVLRAPDIPSVLLELGYLSNAEDEQLMMTAGWQSEMAGAVSSAIDAFLVTRSVLAQ